MAAWVANCNPGSIARSKNVWLKKRYAWWVARGVPELVAARQAFREWRRCLVRAHDAGVSRYLIKRRTGLKSNLIQNKINDALIPNEMPEPFDIWAYDLKVEPYYD